MTDKERMSFWKGGDASEVLRFTDPYEYEGCIIGVSTDGRVVYDFMKVMEYIYEQEKDDYDVSDFKDEEDLRYNIMLKAEDMINHDLSLYNPADKIPVFCRVDEDAEDDEFLIDDSLYDDFYTCTLGPDFREYRYIFSLSKMVNYLMEKVGMEKEEAVRYVYSLKRAGTVEQGVCNYVIVDDLYEQIDINNEGYQDYNDKYSSDFEKDCFEFADGKEFLSSLKKIAEIFRFAIPSVSVLNYIQIKKVENSSSKVLIDASDGRILNRISLDLKNASTVTVPFFLNLRFVNFLASKVDENVTVKIFVGNERLFVKLNDEIYSVSYKEIKYPDFERVISVENLHKAEISIKDLEDFISSIKKEKDLKSIGIKLIFSADNLTLQFDDKEKTIPCTHNCEDGFSAVFNGRYLELLTIFYNEKIAFDFKEPLSAFKFNMNEWITVLMPINPELMA